MRKEIIYLFTLISVIILLQCKQNHALAKSSKVQGRTYPYQLQGFAIDSTGSLHTFENDDWDKQDFSLGFNNKKFYQQESNYVNNIQKTKGKIIVALKHRGLFYFDEKEKKLKPFIKGFVRPVSFDVKAQREFTAISSNGNFATHKHQIFVRNSKKLNSYRELKFSISKTNFFTAIEQIGNHLYVATGLNGLYQTKISSKLNKISNLYLRKTSYGLKFIPHNRKLLFYEEINAIHSTNGKNLFVGSGIQGELYYRKNLKSRFERIRWPFKSEHTIDVYKIISSKKENKIWVLTSQGFFETNLSKLIKSKNLKTEQFYSYSKSIKNEDNVKLQSVYFESKRNSQLNGYHLFRKVPSSNKKIKRLKMASNRESFYSSAYNFRKRKSLVKAAIKRGNYNALVLDLKDDFGYIRYKTKVPFIKKIGAIRSFLDLPKIIKYVHNQKKYLIARLVVFKDPVLFRVRGFSLLDKYSGRPWIGTPKERWVDAFNPDLATKYYVPLVKELEQLGIDEIQLDYIRFPSDGKVWRIRSQYGPKIKAYRSEALENFLAKIRAAISIPLGVDIYGYNGIYRSPGVIGQDIEALGRHVDVIGPMLYSSHVGNSYLTNRPRAKRVYKLMHHSALRYLFLAQDNFIVRPYLQAFTMRARVWGQGERYYIDQIKGAEDAGGKGFMFWGSYRDLMKVEKAIIKYRK